MQFPNVTSPNAPCPCDSGERFRECHGRLDAAWLAAVRPHTKSGEPTEPKKIAPPVPSSVDIQDILAKPYLERLPHLRRSISPIFPDFLYRYQAYDTKDETSIDWLRDALIRSLLWLSSPSGFNDPDDMRAKIRLPDTDAKQHKALLQKLDSIKPSGNQSYKEFRANQLMKAGLEETVHESLRKHCDESGVYCLSERLNYSPMWSHYAAKHQRLALEFDVAQQFFALAIPVQYHEELPIVEYFKSDWASDLGPVMRRKHPDWSAEREWRIIHIGHARSYLPFAPAALTGIILGCRASPELEKIVRSMLDERVAIGLPAVRLYRARQHDSEYKLIIKKA